MNQRFFISASYLVTPRGMHKWFIATRRYNTSRFSKVKWFLLLAATSWSFVKDLSNEEVLAGMVTMIWQNLTTFGNSRRYSCWNFIQMRCWFGFLFSTWTRFDSDIRSEFMVVHDLFSTVTRLSAEHSSIAGWWCKWTDLLQHLYVEQIWADLFKIWTEQSQKFTLAFLQFLKLLKKVIREKLQPFLLKYHPAPP